MLYGANSHYRDHVIHTLYVWKTGVEELIKEPDLLEEVKQSIFPQQFPANVTQLEIISIWTIIALCHDLGYPLEKSRNIFEKTQKMMEFFVQFPQTQYNISFSGVQDELNQFILKFMSSKMKKVERQILSTQNTSADSETSTKTKEGKDYVARIQSKYYVKFSKSLEKYNHGILSAIILYKILIYFIESEYSLNEDYSFTEKEAKQFYIKREILRAISTHTCPDIYHMYSQTLSLLLIVCDDMQEYDRRNFIEMYTGEKTYSHESFIAQYTTKLILVKDTITLSEDISIFQAKITQACRLFKELQKRFRDGLDTAERAFTFQRIYSFKEEDGQGKEFCKLELTIPNDTAATLKLTHTDTRSNACQIACDELQSKFKELEVTNPIKDSDDATIEQETKDDTPTSS